MAHDTIKRHRLKQIALIIISILLLYLSYSQLRFAYIKHRLGLIAGQLLETQSSPDVVFIGDSTAGMLKYLSSKEGASWRIRRGDAPIIGIGDRKADACIMYVLDEKEVLDLRMSVKWGEVHILGFWTPY